MSACVPTPRPPVRHLRPSRPTDLPFMLPTLVTALPPGPGWVFEIKWDGVRVLAERVRGQVQLWSRGRVDVTARYPEVVAAIAALAGDDLALDGEIVALDQRGQSSFHRLARRMHLTRGVGAAAVALPVTYYVYDCLRLAGRDVRGLPLLARKALVRDLIPAHGTVRYADHVAGDGRAFFAAACKAGLEGVVAKRADARYRGGRRPEWRKIKCHRRQEFVIGGYTDPKGSRSHLGALHLGVYDGDALVYVGRVGSGFDERALRALHDRLRSLAVPRCPFTGGAPPRGQEHHWVRPELVCEVRFGEWTPDGSLRHPVYLGLRSDKQAAEVRREEPATPRS